MPNPPNAACTAASWPGSANTPPAQYGEPRGGMLSEGTATAGSSVQKAEPASRSLTIAVTTRVVWPDGVLRARLLPGCSPNIAAVCAVAATPTAPAGTGFPSDPATTRACPASGSR